MQGNSALPMTRQSLAYIYAVSAVLLWSTVASAFKISLLYLDVWQLLFISSLTATLFLLIILVLQKKNNRCCVNSNGMT